MWFSVKVLPYLEAVEAYMRTIIKLMWNIIITSSEIMFMYEYIPIL